MKTSLVIQFNSQEFKISAYELEQVAVDVMRELYINITKRRYKLEGPHDGIPISPKIISEHPHEWLYQATCLKQGLMGHKEKIC